MHWGPPIASTRLIYERTKEDKPESLLEMNSPSDPPGPLYQRSHNPWGTLRGKERIIKNVTKAMKTGTHQTKSPGWVDVLLHSEIHRLPFILHTNSDHLLQRFYPLLTLSSCPSSLRNTESKKTAYQWSLPDSLSSLPNPVMLLSMLFLDVLCKSVCPLAWEQQESRKSVPCQVFPCIHQTFMGRLHRARHYSGCCCVAVKWITGLGS